jgi:hypothetical protein
MINVSFKDNFAQLKQIFILSFVSIICIAVSTFPIRSFFHDFYFYNYSIDAITSIPLLIMGYYYYKFDLNPSEKANVYADENTDDPLAQLFDNEYTEESLTDGVRLKYLLLKGYDAVVNLSVLLLFMAALFYPLKGLVSLPLNLLPINSQQEVLVVKKSDNDDSEMACLYGVKLKLKANREIDYGCVDEELFDLLMVGKSYVFYSNKTFLGYKLIDLKYID